MQRVVYRWSLFLVTCIISIACSGFPRPIEVLLADMRCKHNGAWYTFTQLQANNFSLIEEHAQLIFNNAAQYDHPKILHYLLTKLPCEKQPTIYWGDLQDFYLEPLVNATRHSAVDALHLLFTLLPKEYRSKIADLLLPEAGAYIAFESIHFLLTVLPEEERASSSWAKTVALMNVWQSKYENKPRANFQFDYLLKTLTQYLLRTGADGRPAKLVDHAPPFNPEFNPENFYLALAKAKSIRSQIRNSSGGFSPDATLPYAIDNALDNNAKYDRVPLYLFENLQRWQDWQTAAVIGQQYKNSTSQKISPEILSDLQTHKNRALRKAVKQQSSSIPYLLQLGAQNNELSHTAQKKLARYQEQQVSCVVGIHFPSVSFQNNLQNATNHQQLTIIKKLSDRCDYGELAILLAQEMPIENFPPEELLALYHFLADYYSENRVSGPSFSNCYLTTPEILAVWQKILRARWHKQDIPRQTPPSIRSPLANVMAMLSDELPLCPNPRKNKGFINPFEGRIRAPRKYCHTDLDREVVFQDTANSFELQALEIAYVSSLPSFQDNARNALLNAEVVLMITTLVQKCLNQIPPACHQNFIEEITHPIYSALHYNPHNEIEKHSLTTYTLGWHYIEGSLNEPFIQDFNRVLQMVVRRTYSTPRHNAIQYCTNQLDELICEKYTEYIPTLCKAVEQILIDGLKKINT